MLIYTIGTKILYTERIGIIEDYKMVENMYIFNILNSIQFYFKAKTTKYCSITPLGLIM